MASESDHVEIDEQNPFLMSGTKVITDGTSVRMKTACADMGIVAAAVTIVAIPEGLALAGLAVTVLVLVVMLIRYFARNTRDEMGKREFQGKKTKFDDVMNSVFGFVVAPVRIVVVEIPEGLPLAFFYEENDEGSSYGEKTLRL
ncbi:hypothetical protein Dsin_024045 [Dipteronia sinensis]|uniref:Uncharacterized protein n=1 Tax=Dipteronia sinensis TaxID=43782 RepID=A0AAE0A521_9ROSI|nr:hypothetical protein Dsin_024045 [Dipteronia sinensis]